MTLEINTMRGLVEQLKAADIAYYKYDSPIMTDMEYDALYERLSDLEHKTGIVLSGSPTQKVSGDVLEGLEQVPHTKPMLSAGKTKSVDEVVKFINGKAAIVTWKLDGLTLVLRYEDGELVRALTRGTEGRVGEDVTHTVRVFTNVPLVIPCKEPFEVRGEGVVGWNNFNKLNQDIEVPYSHPRSLAAGAVRRLDASKSRDQLLEFHAFELVSDNGDYSSKQEQFKFLSENGFDVVHYAPIAAGASHSQVVDSIKGFDPKKYDYPVDGCIIEFDDLEYGKSLGSTGHHENRMIAFKWEDELYETTFLWLELATTRTGMVSLTGVFKDVEIDGTKVNRAYLHNLNILDGLRLGVGDRIQVYKANKIIPQIAENLTRSGTIMYPENCPCCGSLLMIHTSDSGTRALYCENPTCSAKLVRRFVHFCDKTRMNIPDLSEKRLELFTSNGWIKDFGDLYRLERHREEFIGTPGLGKKLFERIINTVNERRCCTLNQFIAGLGIPMVGRSAGRILNEHFKGDWDAFEQAIKDGFDFTQLKDFGSTMHDNIYAWYSDTEEQKLWRPLLEHVTFKKYEEETDNMVNTDNPFNGKTVVATGKLENYTRDSIKMKLLSLGAKPSESVNKKTDYLLVGDKAGSKLDKAKEIGVEVITEEQFETMISV